jgi:hypothetical protein
VDVTPHLAIGAALGARVRWPSAALGLALLSHFVLDAIPHFHIGWIAGDALFEAIDLAIGLTLTGLIAWRARHLWPLAGGFVALLPDAPGVRGRWEEPFSGILPHPMWNPPWGIMTQIVVAGLAFLWGMQQAATTYSGAPHQ